MEHHGSVELQGRMIDYVDIGDCADFYMAAPIEPKKLRLGSRHLADEPFERKTLWTISTPVRKAEGGISRVANLRKVRARIAETQNGLW